VIKKVLIVEDNELQAKLLNLMLQDEGFIIVVASGGVEALKILKDVNFDLIVSDVNMPEMDGYSLARNVKSTLKKSIPFLIYSSVPLDKEEIELSAGDIDRYIVKAGVQGIKDEIMQYLKSKH